MVGLMKSLDLEEEVGLESQGGVVRMNKDRVADGTGGHATLLVRINGGPGVERLPFLE